MSQPVPEQRSLDPQPIPVQPPVLQQPPRSGKKKGTGWIIALVVCLAVAVASVVGIVVLGLLGGGTEAPAVQDDGTSAMSPEATVPAVESLSLTIWCPQEQMDFVCRRAEAFAMENPHLDITFHVESVELADAGSHVAADPGGSADLYFFTDDQVPSLVSAGALMPVEDGSIAARNVSTTVEAASVDGILYAYPLEIRNGYFLYYDKSVLSESDVRSWDTLLDAAQRSGREAYIDICNGWYIHGFYQGAELGVTMGPDGNNKCDWASAKGVLVSQSIAEMSRHPACFYSSGGKQYEKLQKGELCAFVSGYWDYGSLKDAWGDDLGICKLPTFTVDGRQVQMGSFLGCAVVGVNPHGENPHVAAALADWITNQESQMMNTEIFRTVPTNHDAIASDLVWGDPLLSAQAEQAEYAVPQRIAPGYWNAAERLGRTLTTKSLTTSELWALLEETEEIIEAPWQ